MGIGNVTSYQPFAPVEQLSARIALRRRRCSVSDTAGNAGDSADDDSAGPGALDHAGDPATHAGAYSCYAPGHAGDSHRGSGGQGAGTPGDPDAASRAQGSARHPGRGPAAAPADARRRHSPRRPRPRRPRSIRRMRRCRPSPASRSRPTRRRISATCFSPQPGATSAGLAPGASRPILRGLADYRVRLQENGVGSSDVSTLGQDHGVPLDPLTIDKTETLSRAGRVALRLAGDRRHRRSRSTTAFRRSRRRAASPPSCGRPAPRSTTDGKARCCSTPAAATRRSTPTCSAAAPTTTASRAILICSRPIPRRR